MVVSTTCMHLYQHHYFAHKAFNNTTSYELKTKKYQIPWVIECKTWYET